MVKEIKPRSVILKAPSSHGPVTLRLLQKGKHFTVHRAEWPDGESWGIAFTVRNGVEPLDNDSDANQVLGLSTAVKVGDVFLSSTEMRANSEMELESALKKAKIQRFNPEDI